MIASAYPLGKKKCCGNQRSWSVSCVDLCRSAIENEGRSQCASA